MITSYKTPYRQYSFHSVWREMYSDCMYLYVSIALLGRVEVGVDESS